MQIRNISITDSQGTHNVIEVTGSIGGVLTCALDTLLPWEDVTGINCTFTIKLKAAIDTVANIGVLGNQSVFDVTDNFTHHSIDVGGYTNTELSFEFETDDPVYIEEWGISGTYLTSTYSGDPDDPESEYIITNTAHSFSAIGGINTSIYAVDSGVVEPDEVGSIESVEGGMQFSHDGKDVAVLGETSNIGEMEISDDEGIGTVYESKVIGPRDLGAIIINSTYAPHNTDNVKAYVDGVEVTPTRIEAIPEDGTVQVYIPFTSGAQVASISYTADAVYSKYYTFGSRRAGRVNGSMSTAIGTDNVADGVLSVAIGEGAEASAKNAKAFGKGVRAYHENETVIGTYNAPTVSDMLFVIGNGYSDDNRRNAVEVDWDGNLYAHNIDAGWVPVTISTTSVVGTASNLEAYRHNGMMHIAFTVRATIPSGSWTTIANVANNNKYKPLHDTYTYGGVTSRPIGIRVTAAGAVQVYSSSAIDNNILYGSIQYPTASDILNISL